MTTINTTDPRLTAFVLGELSAEEAAEIQTALDQSVELQTEVAAIREIVAQIETAMREEDVNRAQSVSSGIPVSYDTGSVNVHSVNVRRRWLISAAITAVAASLVAALVLPLVLNTEPGAERSTVIGIGPDFAAKKTNDKLSRDYAQNQSLRQSGLPSSFPMDNESAETLAESMSPGIWDTATARQNVEMDITFSSRAVEGRAREAEETSSDPSLSPPASTPLREKQRLELTEELQPAERLGGDAYAAGMRGGGARSQPGMQPARPAIPSPTQQPADGLAYGLAERSDSDRRRYVQITPPIAEEPPTRGWTPPAPERVVVNDSYNNARNEAYKQFTENDFLPVKLGEFSTFSIDVDTASYTTMRRYIKDMNQRPPVESVRLEEYLNYFTYDYAQPDGDKPFATHVEVFPCPWKSEHLLARIGIKGKEYSIEERPPLNLVFLVDVSGSMAPANRLPLVKQGLTELVEKLQPKDRVAIVTYANNTALALPSVSAQEKRAILDTINGLRASGGTYGESGIKLAYDTARRYFDKEAQNRVILCTDGDFNIGVTNNKTLEEMIGEEAKSGVFLTILGFGMGNIKDDRLKTLSMRGNGNYGYIDSIDECRKLLVEGLSSTLFTIAKDVKIQVDFNPAHVSGYRLLGYENRKLRDEDFHNDAVDAGDIGAGHTVTALYEIVPAGVRMPQSVDSSRYELAAPPAERASEPRPEGRESEFADELMFVKLRYKEPDSERSSLLEYPVKKEIKEASGDSQFASAVALYGMLLRSSRHSGKGTWDSVLELAMPNTMEDKYREEFIDMVRKAKNF